MSYSFINITGNFWNKGGAPRTPFEVDFSFISKRTSQIPISSMSKSIEHSMLNKHTSQISNQILLALKSYLQYRRAIAKHN